MQRLVFLALAACGSTSNDPPAATPDAAGADAADLCTTTVTYGSSWIRPAGHDTQTDVVHGHVSWDGTCTNDGDNSYATLSNGWKPYFQGHGTCAIALDTSYCLPDVVCDTRITYGAGWIPSENHATSYDDTNVPVFWDGKCTNSVATLSNGWAPHFTGDCEMSLRWTDCGGLYINPVIAKDCPDPGVTHDGSRYILSCTSGNAGNAFPLYVSNDLVNWTAAGHILPSASKPAWAMSDFWAPEIHKVGTKWLAVFSARGTDGKLAIGAASATNPLGPYTALAQPLVPATTVGLIDASVLTAGGTSYLLWKEDGNAQNAPTPIRARALAADGLSVTGNTSTLITNDQTWEGNLVEGPFAVEHAGMYYLFYSGNAYYDGRYAVGVARASSPLGPYTKAPAPIVTTNADWVGPGHCSVIGDKMIYHAWNAAHDARQVLVDEIQWGSDGWPRMYGGPSKASRPLH